MKLLIGTFLFLVHLLLIGCGPARNSDSSSETQKVTCRKVLEDAYSYRVSLLTEDEIENTLAVYHIRSEIEFDENCTFKIKPFSNENEGVSK